jgi:hypothetical protein
MEPLPYMLADLLRQSVAQPRDVAARLLALNLPMPVLWQAMALVVALSAVVSSLAAALFAQPEASPLTVLTGSPLRLALFQAAGILLIAGGMAAAGRMFGGAGSFAQALVLSIWIEFVLFFVQLLQLLLMLLFPLFASMLGMVALALFLWLLTQFTAALHGFVRTGTVFAGVLAALFLAAFAAAILLGVFGLMPTAEG